MRTLSAVVAVVLQTRGRWIGRRCATAADARGLTLDDARGLLLTRSRELREPTRTGSGEV